MIRLDYALNQMNSSKFFLSLNNGYDFVRKTRAAWRWHFSLKIWLWSECILYYSLLFIFLSWKYIMKFLSSTREGSKIFQEVKCWFQNNKLRKALVLWKWTPRMVVTFHSKSHTSGGKEGAGVKTGRPWGFPGRPALACVGKRRDFVLTPVLFVMMISSELILLNKGSEEK